jgi:hypothetical protein
MKKSLLAVVLLAMVAGLTATARAESELDFTLVNKTGYGIKEVYVAPSASTTWEESIIDEVLENGEEVEVKFDPKGKNPAKWDIMIVFVDDNSKVYWKGYKLTEISKLTLTYNRETGVTKATAE